MRGISAIDIVADEVRSERAAQLGHFDAVETKAGVLLGFAGAITALSPSLLPSHCLHLEQR